MTHKMIKIIKKIFYEALIIILISTSAAVIVNSMRGGHIPFFPADINSLSEKNSANEKGVQNKISLNEAAEKFNSGKAVFVDSRSKNDYLQGHIRGALSLPEKEFDIYINGFQEKVHPDTEIITYCDGINCKLAKDLAEKLYFIGFENINYISNGWSAWKEQSLPVIKAEKKAPF